MFMRAIREIFGRPRRQRKANGRCQKLMLESLEDRIVPIAEFNGPLPDWINVQTSSQ